MVGIERGASFLLCLDELVLLLLRQLFVVGTIEVENGSCSVEGRLIYGTKIPLCAEEEYNTSEYLLRAIGILPYHTITNQQSGLATCK